MKGVRRMAFGRDDEKVDQPVAQVRCGEGGPLPFHKLLVAKRLYLQAQARFLVSAGIVVGALAARYALDVRDLPVANLAALAALLCLLDVPVFLVARRCRDGAPDVHSYRLVSRIMHVTIDVDFVFLTLTLWFVGGARSPFQSIYLLHVVIAAAFSTPGAACAHAAFGYALFAGLVFGEWSGIVPMQLPLGLVNDTGPLDGRFALTLLAAQAIIVALAISLVTSLTRVLRKGEEQLRSSNADLNRISKLRRDFLHIALHDFKAPVNAAIMLVQNLRMTSVPSLSEQQEHWVERIQIRLNDALAFLHDFSLFTFLETGEMQAEIVDIDLGEIARAAAAENQDTATDREQTLSVDIEDNLPHGRCVPRLFHEAVANLISNASKYTPSGGAIVVRAFRRDDAVRIEVEDNGIGIAPEDQERLFQDFVRIKRQDSAVGEVTGTGLGLSIVRRIAEAYGGRAGVVSELNKGSTFFLELPAARHDPGKPNAESLDTDP